MGKQLQTFDKAQALAMHYIPCCKLVALFHNTCAKIGQLVYNGKVYGVWRPTEQHKTLIKQQDLKT